MSASVRPAPMPHLAKVIPLFDDEDKKDPAVIGGLIKQARETIPRLEVLSPDTLEGVRTALEETRKTLVFLRRLVKGDDFAGYHGTLATRLYWEERAALLEAIEKRFQAQERELMPSCLVVDLAAYRRKIVRRKKAAEKRAAKLATKTFPEAL